MVKDVLAELRSHRLAENERAQRDYYRALDNEQFLELERSLKDLYKCQGLGEDCGAAISKLEQKRAEILRSLGLKIEPVRTCQLCEDTGYRGATLCLCVRQRVMTQAGAVCDVDNNLGGISCCTADIFQDERQRATMGALYKSMSEFCVKFPQTDIINMTFSGGTGTGKTYLVKNLSAELSAKGYNVLFVTAFGLNQVFLKIHTSPIESKGEIIEGLLDADMLIIDDLGTENLLRNVTIEYLTNIVTERMINRKHTIITTNLVQEEILIRYGERVFSRINNKSNSVFVSLDGKDIRLQGK